MPKKLLLICSRTFPGSHRVLKNLKMVLKDSIDAHIIPIEELFCFRPQLGSYRIEKRIRQIQTDLHLVSIDKLMDYGNNILFAAWGPAYDVVLKKLNKKGITPSLIMCSTPGQSELSRHELMDYCKIIEYLKRGEIKYWLLNRRLYNSIGRVIKQSTYFPHTIDLNQFANIVPQHLDGKNIDLFCLPRLGKNVLNQVLGFKLSGVSAKLHINFRDRVIDLLITRINAPVVHHDWMEVSAYNSFIAAMDLSLQATFTESFSYAVAERMCLGVPAITSYDIYFTAEDPFLSKYLCIKALDTPPEIAGAIKRILESDNLRQDLSEKCRNIIEKIARTNNREARDFILGFVE